MSAFACFIFACLIFACLCYADQGQGGDTLILIIDIGNTNIKFTGIAGFSQEGKRGSENPDFSLLFEEKLPTASGKDVGEFLQQAELLLGPHGISFGQGKTVQAVAISSVVPADTPAAVCLAEKICAAPPVVISCRSDSGLSFEGLPAPDKVGTDRIADAAWAAACYPLPAMTVDLGTATTINVIGPAEGEADGKAEAAEQAVKDGRVEQREFPGKKADSIENCGPARCDDMLRPGLRGVFLGGMIGAGVSTSLHALRTGTAQLPALEPRAVPEENLIGIDTDGCMLSSAIVGTAAMIEGLASRVEEQLGRPVTLILTGGNARYVSPWIRRPFVYESSLASKGTAVIALRELSDNKEKTF